MLTVYRCVLPGSFDEGWTDRVELHNRKVEQIPPGWHRTEREAWHEASRRLARMANELLRTSGSLIKDKRSK